MDNKFIRTINLIGEDKFNKLKDKHILILGLGGVGGYALEALVRSGISNITIVDYDTIDETNINRQIIANINNIGNKKTKAWKLRIEIINPKCHINIIDKFIDTDNINELFETKVDYLIDACDSLNTKKSIIIECLKRNIKFISCMGMGNKLNPELISICDIRKTSNDKIAKILRKFIKDNGINKKITVVSSTEVPIKSEKVNSVSFVPSVAGMMCASYIVNDIVNEK